MAKSTRISASFLDRFTDSIEELPIPFWLVYTALFVLQSFLMHFVAWKDGWLAENSFSPLLLISPMWLWAPLAIITFLDRKLVKAIDNFSPLLKNSKEELDQLTSEFTTMSNTGVIINGTIWTLFYFLIISLAIEPFFVTYELGELATKFYLLSGIPSFFIGSAVFYHSSRQLWLVKQTIGEVEHFNLFNLEPVYAFSRFTAISGIIWMGLLTLNLVLIPHDLASLPILASWPFKLFWRY